MKLPESRKERVQVLILLSMGVIFVLFSILEFGVAPLRASIAGRRARLKDLEVKLGDAGLYLEQSTRQQKNSNAMIRELLSLSHHHLLQDEVGNFLLPATAAIQRFGQAAGVTNIEVRQVGFVNIPQARETHAVRSFKAYKVRATAFCAYSNLVELVGLINDSSPYIAVCGLDIVARPATPMEHAVTLDVQWPVWVDPTVERQLLNELEQVDDTAEAPAATNGTPAAATAATNGTGAASAAPAVEPAADPKEVAP